MSNEILFILNIVLAIVFLISIGCLFHFITDYRDTTKRLEEEKAHYAGAIKSYEKQKEALENEYLAYNSALCLLEERIPKHTKKSK